MTPALRLALALALCAVVGCDASDPPTADALPVRLDIGPAPVVLEWVGEQAQLTATLRDTAGRAVPGAWTFTWSSGHTGVASVDANGLVTAAGAGRTDVRVESAGLTATVEVAVDPRVAILTVASPSVTLHAVGDTVRLVPEALDRGGSPVADPSIQWTHADASIATIDGGGLITAVSAGSTIVTGVADTARVTVGVRVQPRAASLRILPDSARLTWLGDTLRLVATATDANGQPVEPGALEWRSDDSTIASVDTEGTVTAVGAGTTAITVQADTLRASMSVRVEQVAASIRLEPDSLILSRAGDTTRIHANVEDEGGSPLPAPTLSWTTTNPAVATVDATGLVTARGSGAAFISAAVDSLLATSAVEVSTPGVPAAPSSRIALGSSSTCFLDPAGKAHCVGANSSGQLGDGTTVDRTSPVPVQGGNVFASVSGSPGARHVCGLTPARSVLCWGANSRGQATGAPGGRALAPTSIPLNGAVRQVALGSDHTCTLSDQGVATCWGRNDEGQLGFGPVGSTGGPASVPSLPPLVHLTAGRGHTCGLTASGDAYCWGDNGWGQLGNGSEKQLGVPPSLVVGGHIWRTIDAGVEGTCGLDTQDRVFCWGWGYTTGGTPQPVAGPSASDLHLGNAFACVRDQAGEAWCWGNNEFDQLSGSTQPDEAVPVRVTGGHRFRELAAGTHHACGLDASDRILCWGGNYAGQLGVGGVLLEVYPQRVPGTQGFTAVVAAYESSCALDAGGRVHCWGGRWGRDGPTLMDPGLALVKLDAGVENYCGLSAAGQAYCWGANQGGRLGTGDLASHLAPTPVASSVEFEEISTDDWATCAIDRGNQLYCWGQPWGFLFGVESYDQELSPIPVSPGPAFTQIGMGGRHACGLDVNSTIHCWGSGDPVGAGPSGGGLPAPVVGNTAFTALSVNGNNSCGIDTAGVAWCWGGNVGQPTRSSNVPAQVAGSTAAVRLGTGHRNCSIDASGTLECWGRGPLGDGTTALDASWTPVRVPLPASAVDIAPGEQHMCAVGSDAWVYCWGVNNQGQLGLPAVLPTSREPLVMGS